MARLNTPYRSLLSEADLEHMGPGGLLNVDAGQRAPQVRVATPPPALNYQDIIAQATRAGFTPYAGDGPMQAMVGGLEVNPYFELTGQTEQDIGTPQQRGYTVSTPLGGTTYRSDVVDMAGNLDRSNVHDAGSDKYGLQDMAKLAAVALGANYLPGMLGAEGSLTAGLTPEAVAAAEAALPTALSSAPLSTTLAAPLAELGTVGGLGQTAIGTLPGMPATAASALGADAAVQQIVTTGSRAAAAPSLLSTAGPAAAAATVAASTLATDPANYSNEGRNPTDRANMGPDAPSVPTVDVSTGPLDSLKAWATANPTLARMLFSGAGALLNTAGGPGGSAPGGYVDSGYRPTISRGGFNAAPQARQMAPQPTGLLTTPTTGQPNSGLWRYSGLLGG